MKKFLVLYMAPAFNLEQWLKIAPEERKLDEATMKVGWDAWIAEHRAILTGVTAGAGKTKRVTADGIEDVKNDVMLYSIVEAGSHEEAAEAFKAHPHFGIPSSWIDIMPINPLSGMGEV